MRPSWACPSRRSGRGYAAHARTFRLAFIATSGKRNAAIDDLSSYGNVTVTNNSDGSINVAFAGVPGNRIWSQTMLQAVVTEDLAQVTELVLLTMGVQDDNLAEILAELIAQAETALMRRREARG